jgi:hypothetical protein
VDDAEYQTLDCNEQYRNFYEENYLQKYICTGWNRLAFHLKPINIVRLLDKTQKTKKNVEEDVII